MMYLTFVPLLDFFSTSLITSLCACGQYIPLVIRQPSMISPTKNSSWQSFFLRKSSSRLALHPLVPRCMSLINMDLYFVVFFGIVLFIVCLRKQLPQGCFCLIKCIGGIRMISNITYTFQVRYVVQQHLLYTFIQCYIHLCTALTTSAEFQHCISQIINFN